MSERRTEEQASGASGGEAPGGAGARGAGEARPRFNFARVWRVAAYALLAVAAALLYMGRTQAAFLFAALAASAWFLHVRATLIRKHDLVKVGRRDWRPRREVEREPADEEEED